jgi:enoyl-CoA hydratase/carnithine racemase
MAMSDDLVLFDLNEHGVATLTLNRPERMNAWTDEMGWAYFDLLEQCAKNPAVRVIVVTGAGRAWCAGADMNALTAITEGARPNSDRGTGGEVVERAVGVHHHWFTTTVPKPVIAALNGPVAGMGFSQATMCDMRFAAAGVKITSSFSQRGLIAEWGVSWTLPRLVGTANAMDLLMSGRVVLAEEAVAMGLVNKVFPAETFMADVMAYANTLATTSSPTSWAVIKRQVYASNHQTLPDAEAEAVRLMRESFGRPDFKEGVQSYLQRRPPAFAPASLDV